jgi:hypothetical protein
VEYIEGRPGGKIEIPDSGIHGRTAYMARHELLDGACRPENEVEHAMLEEQNLMGLEKEGSYGVLGHGLLMHDVRNKHNPGPFKAIRGTVDRMVKKYRKWVEKAREEILSLYPHEHAYFRA